MTNYKQNTEQARLRQTEIKDKLKLIQQGIELIRYRKNVERR